MLYQTLARPVLFRIGRGDAEAAHDTTLRWLSRVSTQRQIRNALIKVNRVNAPVEVCGIRFPNPIGLAAGMDKKGLAIGAWPALGFGFAELGTVTGQAQPGNPQPRMYRLRKSGAIINRMGFNNDGAQALAARLTAAPPVDCPLGISIGKSKAVPIEQAVPDYLHSLRTLYPFADYFAVNVSSPNTPGLRQLQDSSALRELLGAIRAEGDRIAAGRPRRPVFVKIAPDLTESAIAQLLEVCLETGVAGVIATNTTLGRDRVDPSEDAIAAEPGGLSGRPLTEVSREIVRFVHTETGGRLPIIGSGGIMTPDDAASMFDAGASLVQIYSGLIYGGPSVVRGSVRRYKKFAKQRAKAAAHPPSRPSPTT
ncbi:quinone-dependent dihydroorotate dehydrogenase [Glycomyces buryatensis]|uniref:Dihydroorotate dehydrogenase (quinone) n=2 Tax=Glycomyces buryatensis TaxID=2570927 RepID=A0A4S8QBN6_9ACTN|nr:quinone-dependent dihydroorotate dehydrogenase [Glycomyces buryatensis]THV38459.1 quinone-dependent dihydroorotate dehydrogenase [Glycomyces buryatensis]